LSAFANENGHLVRSGFKSGVGSTESRQYLGENTSQTDELKKLFGRGSNAMAANALAQRDPNEYRRLKREAQRQGIIR